MSDTKQLIQCQVKNYEKLTKDIRDIEKASEKALKNTVSDMKARAPGLIASAVTDAYNIKKSEVTPSKSSKPKKMAGTIKIKGDTLESLRFIYEGRLLTPTHFGMKPTTRPAAKVSANGKKKRAAAYTVTSEIKKNQRKALGSDVFLGSNKGSGQIPFQRAGKERTPILSVKTLSMPQMITNDKTSADIEAKLREGLQARLEHHTKRQLGLS